MLKHFFKKNTKKQANQTAFAGIEKKNHSRVGATLQYVAYCPITLRHDNQT